MSFTCKKYVQRHTKSHLKDQQGGGGGGKNVVEQQQPMESSNVDLSMPVPVSLTVPYLILPNQTEPNICV